MLDNAKGEVRESYSQKKIEAPGKNSATSVGLTQSRNWKGSAEVSPRILEQENGFRLEMVFADPLILFNFSRDRRLSRIPVGGHLQPTRGRSPRGY